LHSEAGKKSGSGFPGTGFNIEKSETLESWTSPIALFQKKDATDPSKKGIRSQQNSL
jgi:hypothetical protein